MHDKGKIHILSKSVDFLCVCKGGFYLNCVSIRLYKVNHFLHVIVWTTMFQLHNKHFHYIVAIWGVCCVGGGCWRCTRFELPCSQHCLAHFVVVVVVYVWTWIPLCESLAIQEEKASAHLSQTLLIHFCVYFTFHRFNTGFTSFPFHLITVNAIW